MKKIYLFLSITALLAIFACGADQNGDGTVVRHTVPDSLNNALLIASFYDTDEGGHVVLRFDDKSRVSGKKITFFESKQISYQDIVPSGNNKFLCEYNNTEYEVLDNKVVALSGGIISRNISVANLPESKEFIRTDH
jgi:hypothetical protein